MKRLLRGQFLPSDYEQSMYHKKLKWHGARGGMMPRMAFKKKGREGFRIVSKPHIKTYL